MRIFSRIRSPRRLRGFVLISVLLGLTLVTSLLVAAQRLAVETSADIVIGERLVGPSDHFADLIAVAGTLEQSADPWFFEDRGVWMNLQNANGLVDLNAAAVELVEVILRAEGIEPTAILGRLDDQRTMAHDTFFSLTDAFDTLGIVHDRRASIARFVTVSTGNISVDPDAAPRDVGTQLEQALSTFGIAPLDTASTVFRIQTSEERDGPFSPLFYVHEVEPGRMRMAEVMPRF